MPPPLPSKMLDFREGIDKPNDLTDYDLCELYIKCVAIFAETGSKLDLETHNCFTLGQVLWEKTIEARDEYRKSHPLEATKKLSR